MFALNTQLNIKIFNSLIPFLFLTVVIACNNSATIEGGNVLERTSDNNSQNAIEEDGNTKKVLKKIIHRVMSDSGKLGMGNVIFSESYDSLGNKLTQYERFDNYYISWTYVNASKDEKGFKRGFGEIDGEKHCLNKECEFVYDSNGKEVETFIYHFSGWPSVFENKFNSDGSIAEKCEYRHNKLIRKNTYQYGKNDKLSEMYVFNGRGKLESKTIYDYDAHGNCIRYCKYGGKDGCLEDIFVIEYEYY